MSGPVGDLDAIITRPVVGHDRHRVRTGELDPITRSELGPGLQAMPFHIGITWAPDETEIGEPDDHPSDITLIDPQPGRTIDPISTTYDRCPELRLRWGQLWPAVRVRIDSEPRRE